MHWPSLKGRIKIAVEPGRLLSRANKADLSLNHRSILEAETGVHGCIINEVLRFIVNKVRWSNSVDGLMDLRNKMKMKHAVRYWTSLK